MASVNWKKYKGGAAKAKIKAQFRHCCEGTRLKGRHANKDIDKSRTKLNLAFGAAGTYKELAGEFDKKLKELDAMPKQNRRADRVAMVGVEVPTPAGMDDATAQDWLRAAYLEMKEELGTAKVLGAVAHLDEIHDYVDPKTGVEICSRPHLHVMIIPTDKDERINAKKLMTKAAFNAMNNRLEKMTQREFPGYTFMTGEKKRSPYTVEELKVQSQVAAEVKKAKQATKEAQEKATAAEEAKAKAEAREATAAKREASAEAREQAADQREQEAGELTNKAKTALSKAEAREKAAKRLEAEAAAAKEAAKQAKAKAEELAAQQISEAQRAASRLLETAQEDADRLREEARQDRQEAARTLQRAQEKEQAGSAWLKKLKAAVLDLQQLRGKVEKWLAEKMKAPEDFETYARNAWQEGPGGRRQTVWQGYKIWHQQQLAKARGRFSGLDEAQDLLQSWQAGGSRRPGPGRGGRTGGGGFSL